MIIHEQISARSKKQVVRCVELKFRIRGRVYSFTTTKNHTAFMGYKDTTPLNKSSTQTG